MAHKKSFFEKLTSSIKFNEEEQELHRKTRRRIEPEYEEEYFDEDETDDVLDLDNSHERYEDEIEEVGELSVDMYRIQNAIVIKAMVAGIQKSEIDISLTRDLVTIEGSRSREHESNIEESYFDELYWGAFERTIELPEEVDIELAEAHEAHGLLTLILPLVDKHKQARLKIK